MDLEDKKEKNRNYDALDKDGKRIEIRATGSKKGTTTISGKLEFDFLYWMSFDFESDIVTIRKINKECVEKELKKKTGKNKKKNKGQDRCSIQLKNLDILNEEACKLNS